MPENRGVVNHVIDRLDKVQQATRPSAIVVAVIKRYSEDRASRQAALVTFYGFLSVFPLLLLLVTIAALAFGESTLRHDIVNSALSQFPVVGDKLAANVHAIVAGNTPAVVVAVLGLIWGTRGITNSLQNASAAVWRRPRSEDPSFWTRLRRGFALLGILAAVTVVSTVVAGVAANGVARVHVGGDAGRVVAYVVVLGCNAAGYLAALRLLAPPATSMRTLLPGAVLGSVGWTLLQVLGGWLVGHRLQHASQLYGFFAIVLGLIFWINLGAQLFLYSTELNCVLARHEWPRSVRSRTADAYRRLARWPDAVGSLVAAAWPVVLTLAVLGNPSRYNPYGVYSGAGTVRLHALGTLPTTDPNIYSTAYTLGIRSASLLVHGHLPWWNPFEGLGTPLIGEFESGGLFPFTPLLLLHDGSLIFHLALEVVAGLATYWLLRAYKCNPVVSAVGGMLFATNGTFAWLANAAFNPVCFVPVMLLGVERARSAAVEGRGGGWRWLAIGCAFALVAGFIETAALALVLVAVVAVQRGCTIDTRRVTAFSRKMLAGLVAGIAIAAPVLVAFDAYLRLGYVHLHGGDAASHYLASTYVPMWISPYLFGRIGQNAYPGIHDMWGAVGGYAGFALLALAVASLFGKRDRGLRIVLASWVFISVADSVGMPVIRQLLSALPVLQHIVLYRYLPPTWELALVILAAFALRDAMTATRVHTLIAITSGVLGTACVLLIGLSLAPHAVEASKASTATSFQRSILLIVAVVAGLLLAVMVPAVFRAASLGLVVLVEAGILFAVPLQSWPATAPLDTPMVSFLTTHIGTGRFFSLGPPGANFGTQVGVRQLDIVDLPVPKANVRIYRQLDHYEDPTVFTGVHGPAVVAPPVPRLVFHNLRRFENLGVKYIVAPPAIRAFAHHRHLDHLVYHDRYFDIWQLDTYRALVRTPGCTFVTDTQDSYTVRCPHSSTLLRDELYFPGWSATVNGRAATVIDRGSFEAVALPRGRSVVALSFLPPYVGLSGIALLAAVLALFVPWNLVRLRRRGRHRGGKATRAGRGDPTPTGAPDAPDVAASHALVTLAGPLSVLVVEPPTSQVAITGPPAPSDAEGSGDTSDVLASQDPAIATPAPTPASGDDAAAED